MRKLLFLLAGTALLCVPAVSLAANPSPTKLAVQMCRTTRAQDGKQLFRQTYHSFAGCLKQTKSDARQDVSNAAKTCKAQRNDANFAAEPGHDGKTFQQFYGTNGGNAHGAGKNAFGKCVSTIAKQNAKSDVSNSVAGAKTCKALKKSDPATFRADYGTGRNAFGKCVAKQSSAKQG